MLIICERNWVFAKSSDFLIPISWQPNVLDFACFKLWILISVRSNNLSLKYQKFTPSGLKKNIGIINFKVVAMTQFLSRLYNYLNPIYPAITQKVFDLGS